MIYKFGNFVSSCKKDFVEVCQFKTRPFRGKFVPSKIWNDLDLYRNDIDGFKKYFKKFRTDVIIDIPAKEYDSIPVSGYYTPDTNRIELILSCVDYNKYVFDDSNWLEFKFIIIQVMCHEIVHMMQFVNRDFFWSYRNCKFKKVRCQEKNENRKYHANMDEIQAYAHCIYLELMQFGFDIPKTEKDSYKFKLSVTFNMILGVFGNRMSEPVISKTMFHVKQWDKRYNRV